MQETLLPSTSLHALPMIGGRRQRRPAEPIKAERKITDLPAVSTSSSRFQTHGGLHNPNRYWDTNWNHSIGSFHYSCFFMYTNREISCYKTPKIHYVTTRTVSCRSRDSSVGIPTGYGLDGWGSLPGRGKRFFSTPQSPDRLWGPPSLLPSG
jgi:hypothetical protein